MLGKWNQLYIDLNQLSDQGIVLFLDDSPATPDRVMQALCNDSADYMRINWKYQLAVQCCLWSYNRHNNNNN